MSDNENSKSLKELFSEYRAIENEVRAHEQVVTETRSKLSEKVREMLDTHGVDDGKRKSLRIEVNGEELTASHKGTVYFLKGRKQGKNIVSVTDEDT
jgi:predicted  nucleic acid-binding Zn-ribbon protein